MTAAKGGFAGGEGGDRRNGDSRTGSPRASRASRGEDRFSGNGGGGSHSYHSEADVNGAFFAGVWAWPAAFPGGVCVRGLIRACRFVRIYVCLSFVLRYLLHVLFAWCAQEAAFAVTAISCVCAAAACTDPKLPKAQQVQLLLLLPHIYTWYTAAVCIC